MAQSKIDYVESPLERIVGVHWGGGLAVHFGEKDQPPVDPPPAALRLTRRARADELPRTV
jgi:hypothetical protein